MLDCATKTAFSFDKIFYEQFDGVSMGSCLAPVLANIILTEFEKVIVNDLINTGILAFYRRYVDDNLVFNTVARDVPGGKRILIIKINAQHNALSKAIKTRFKIEIIYCDVSS